MSYFSANFKLEVVPGGWMTWNRVNYHSDYLGCKITVPPQFFTDLASVPKFVPRWIVPIANGKNRNAACLQDWLCQDDVREEMNISQRQADIVFREALGVCGVSRIGQWGLFLPVRGFQKLKTLLKKI